MSDFKFNCPHCQQSLEAPQDMLGETIECPSCNGTIQLPAPEPSPTPAPAARPKLQIKKQMPARSQQAPSRPHSASPQNSSGGTMLFGTCPKCGAEDVYANCMNCERFDRFTGSGQAAKCSCGMQVPDAIQCPYCSAQIFKDAFHPQPGLQQKFRDKLPKDGKAKIEGQGMSIGTIIAVIFLGFWLWSTFSGNDAPFSGGSNASISVSYLAPYTEELTGVFEFGEWKKEVWGYSGVMKFKGWKTMVGRRQMGIEFESRSSSGVVLGRGDASFPTLSPGERGKIELIGYGADDAHTIRLLVGVKD